MSKLRPSRSKNEYTPHVNSPALGARLQAAEAELKRLLEAQAPRPPLIAPNIRGHFMGMLDRLDGVLQREPERGREKLRGILGVDGKLKLSPDESGKFLWAKYSLDLPA